jgi:acyl-CoA thioester hydrolase
MPVTLEVRVRYAETDQMGIVYYANFFVWFELGRVEVLRSLGLTYKQLEIDHGRILPVIEARCRYRAPAHYDEELVIETVPAMLRGTVLKFAYKVFRKHPDPVTGERELLAEGDSVHVVCDNEMKRKHLPEKYEAAIRAMIPEHQCEVKA